MANDSRAAERALRQYLLLRLLITLLGYFLVTFYLATLSPGVRNDTLYYLYSVLSAYLAVGVVAVLISRRGQRSGSFRRVQPIIDFLFQGVLVWSTGGVFSMSFSSVCEISAREPW